MERAEFAEAREFLARHLPQTRLVAAESFSQDPKQKVYLKLESELPTGSFKVRGALYALHVNMTRRAISAVVASSTGNHGAAVAYAAKLLGVKARIFLPENSNPVKKARIQGLGAEIVEKGAVDLAGAFGAASRYAAESGAFFLNDADDPDLPAGPGTIAMEILEKAPAYALSWKAGVAVGTDTCDTIADGLATRTPLAANVEAIQRLVDDVVLVSEREMLYAIRRLALDEQIIAEPAGAAATAAFLKANSKSTAGSVTLLVTGANVSRDILRGAICP